MNEDIQKILKLIISKVDSTKHVWAVVGSTNLALQGVNIEAHDIDILTTEKDVFKIEKILNQYITKSVRYTENGFFKSYFGKFQINGVKVEIMANLQTKQKGTNWSNKARLDKRIYIKYKNLTLPVIPLLEEYKAYVKMGRVETAEKIKIVLDDYNDQLLTERF